MQKAVCSLMFVLISIWSMTADAAHPLITDDAGTQGAGKFQFEFNSQFDRDRENGFKTEATILNSTLTYGINDTIDFSAGIPFSAVKESASGTSESRSGKGDAGVNVKWRFFEKEGLSIALKPGVSIATGDEGKGLGTGKTGYSMFLITTREAKPWGFHANLGYIRNENNADERSDIWHASLTATYDVREDLKVVADIGAETNRDKATASPPVFFLVGLIYCVTENMDIDAGVKIGLTETEVDDSLLAGLTLRF